MERDRAQAVIEAVLFAMGESVAISDLAVAVDDSEKFVKEILEELKIFYAERILLRAKPKIYPKEFLVIILPILGKYLP